MIRATLRVLASLLLAISIAATARAATSPDSSATDTSRVDWSAVPEYRIVPGDMLSLDFGLRADLNGDIIREVTVRPDGRISVFPVGDVVAAGYSPRELEGQLVKLLSTTIREPRVTVELTKLAANQVHVLGEVLRPGPVPADPYLTVVQAISAAGGFKDGANKNSVLVFSRNGASTVHVSVVHVDNELKMGGLAGDLQLSRFDIVYVPRGPIGNLEVYTRMFFGSIHEIATTAISGWELFNLDKVYLGAGRGSNP